MEDNKKGMNVLYPVLGVATLVVAIIGATFAYFSATQTDESIQGTIGAGGLELSVASMTDYVDETGTKVTTGENLIPLDLIQAGDELENENWESQFEDAVKNNCIDDSGRSVCEIYSITVKNPGTSPINVRGNLVLEATVDRELPQNLYWKRLASVSTDDVEYTVGEGEGAETMSNSYVIGATDLKWFEPVIQGTTIDQTESYITKINTAEEGQPAVYVGENVTLEPGASETYYIIIWLEEIGSVQDDVDASNSTVNRGYKGSVIFNAYDNVGTKLSGVTATFQKNS